VPRAQPPTEYDYIIVGAGSAGCVVAARLGEDPDVKVLLIDAGPPDAAPEIHMPIALEQLWQSRYDWGFLSEPEPGLDGQRCYLPRGRVLGGSSSLNAMLYVRGHRSDYDGWAAAGLPGWGYAEVLPYFKRSEDNERGENLYHGVGGPLSVSDGRSRHPYAAAMIEAAASAGIGRNDDHNGARQEGVGWFQATQRDGRRCSAAVAFLAACGANVEVMTDTHVSRVVFEGTAAVGIEIVGTHGPEVLHAAREVVLCAGAYQSPQLLLLSGIGPGDELRACGIDARVELPVGRGLHDHPVTTLMWFAKGESLAAAMTPGNLDLFEREGRGPLTSTLVEAGAFVHTRAGLRAPDMQLHFFAVALPPSHFGPPPAGHGFTIGPTLLRPTSRGSVTLRNGVSHTKPRIVHNYLTTEEDRRTMVDGVRLALEISRQPALGAITRAPGDAPASDSDAVLLAFVKRRTQTIFHPVGTCAMGSVVDAELRVFGVERLRIIDASVMPSVPGGNTNAPTIMVAEKGADLIRGREPLAAVAVP
jgi:choline dehydrogenase-like flavoprotein